jgi:glycosyltransferase involved in cell wall biosynthesis
MIHYFAILFFFLTLPFTQGIEAKKKPPVEFVIVIPSYNNEEWCIKNLESVASQTYPHFSFYYINDSSTDKTKELVDEFISSHALQDKGTVIHNAERRGALANVYDAVHNTDPSKVIVICDGDDWLAHPDVLTKLASVYRNRSVWMTYGSYQFYPGYRKGIRGSFIPDEIAKKVKFRSYKWVSSHLRTYYAKLFQQIKKEDLMYEGKFIPVCTDLATMFPMLELSAHGHFRYIQDVLYTYNTANQLSVGKLHKPLQTLFNAHIRALPPYKPLKSLF